MQTGRHLLRALAAALIGTAAIAGVPTGVRAADVTEVPPDVSTAAVAAFRAGLALHREKQAPAIKEYEHYLARAYLAKGDRAMAARHYEIVRRLDTRLAHCLQEAIRRGDPDYNDMPWGS